MGSVLLLNLGGPSGLGEVRPYLRNLFADPMVLDLPGGRLLRGPLGRMIAALRSPKVIGYYRRIGGGSPLLGLTQRQAEGLRDELAVRGHRDVAVDVVMHYTQPDSRTVLARLGEAGVRRAIALPLYPQECRATTGSHLAALEEARKLVAPDLEIVAIRSYHLHPGYLDALAGRVEESLARLPDGERDDAVLLFSAHGVPVRLPESGDPYVDQICETVAALRARVGEQAEYRLAFQSRTGPVRWVGPATEEVIRGLRGRRTVVVVPVSFVSDHIETLYEIDILFAELAREVGIARFVRTRSLNDSPAFLRALADLVEPHLELGGRADG